MSMKNKFPIYIPSKGRYEVRLTAKALERMGLDYYLVVEAQEYQLYLDHVKDESKLLVLDNKFKESYELLDDLGFTKSTGPGPARNFAWDHALKAGHRCHWVMDDNIYGFARLNHNRRIYVESSAPIRAMEDFFERYTNVGMAGPEYRFFAPEHKVNKPFKLNTRIYSCNLINNDVPFRWRGRYNEDTILSLDMLSAGYCTISFYAFLQNKVGTQVLAGGNTEEFYAKEGTRPKSQMLVDAYPELARMVRRYDRWHHQIDYSVFKQLPILKPGLVLQNKVNNYGMILTKKAS